MNQSPTPSRKGLVALVLILAAAALTVYGVTKLSGKTDSTAHFPAEEANEQTANSDTCPTTAPVVSFFDSQDKTRHLVVLDSKPVGTIGDGATVESEANLYRQSACNAWIVASATGRGGYILYSGEDQLYRLNFLDMTLTRVNFDGFLTDISVDEKTIVSVSTVDGTDGSHPSIEVTDVATGMHVQNIVPDPYNDAGSAKFSPDGMRIAYGAVERDAESNDPIKRAVYIIDLDTGKQTLGPEADLPEGSAVYITGWTDEQTPILSATP